MGLDQELYLKSTLDQLAPPTDPETQLLREEIEEALRRAKTLNERDLIHYPDLIALNKLPNGSQIFAIDYRTIPGNTSKVIPIDHEFEKAEERGEISPEKTPTLIVHSSGNASIWFTKIARQKGYNVEVVVPDYASTPRLNALCALGAKIHLVRGELGIQGLIERAHQLETTTQGAKFLDQTHSPENYQAFIPQGKRAVRKLALNGIRPTHFVAGLGTGGTFSGLSIGIREQVPECQAIGVEVEEKPFLKDTKPNTTIDINQFLADQTTDDNFWTETYGATSQIPGLSANIDGINLTKGFENPNTEIASVTNETALRATRLLGRQFQQFVGPSTGSAFAAAYAIASKQANSTILMPICDLGSQYDGEIWHKEKRQIANYEITGDLIGSTIEVHDHVHQNERTPHLTVREMGGPHGTAAMLYLMEIVARDLELKMGLINETNESLGLGIDGNMEHKAYVPLGNKLIVRTKLTAIDRKPDKTFLTFEQTIHAIDKEGNEVAICNTVSQKRCVLPIAKFRERSLLRFPESQL